MTTPQDGLTLGAGTDISVDPNEVMQSAEQDTPSPEDAPDAEATQEAAKAPDTDVTEDPTLGGTGGASGGGAG